MTAKILPVSRDQAQENTQITAPNEDVKPWQRQKNEPARWFLRYRIYQGLGAKRSLRATIAAEQDQDQAAKGDERQRAEGAKRGHLSNVSVPGAWSRAAKLWRWQERAEAWDMDVQKRRASHFQNTILGSCEYASTPYRIFELNKMVDILDQYIISNAGTDAHFVLACMRQQQALLKDIAAEMRAYPGVDMEKLDAQIAVHLLEEREKKQARERNK